MNCVVVLDHQVQDEEMFVILMIAVEVNCCPIGDVFV